jgi:amino acid permease
LDRHATACGRSDADTPHTMYHCRTAANLAKSIAGAAVFALPFVFARMGVVGGAGVIAFFTVLSLYTMHLLLRAK